MLKQRDIRGFSARYHRNGICGAGFHACSFLFEDGRELVPLKAIVFAEPGHVAVTGADPKQRWRGDDFEDVLREAIRLQDEAQPHHAYE